MSNAEDMPGGGSQLVDVVEFAEALGCPVEGIAKLVSAGSVFFVERDGVQLYACQNTAETTAVKAKFDKFNAALMTWTPASGVSFLEMP